MSTNVARGDFVFDYVVAYPRPRTLGIRLAMAAMAIVLLAGLASSLYGPTAVDEASDVLTQGP